MSNLISQNFADVEGVFENNGFSELQAQGITAGLAAESQLDPSIQEAGGGPGLGIAQFTSPSQQAAFAAIGGVNSSATQQAQLVADELLGNNSINPETNAGNNILGQTTSAGALNSFVSLFERPASTAGDLSRGSQVLSQFGGTTGTSGVGDSVSINNDDDLNLAAATGIGNDTPNLTDADFAGLSDSDVTDATAPALSSATGAATGIAGAGGTPVNITDLSGLDSSVSGAGKAVQSGAGTIGGDVTSAAGGITGTVASAISSLEQYTSSTFVVVALSVMGIIFVAFGLGLFGKNKVEQLV
jgi:Phage tail lysozyme